MAFDFKKEYKEFYMPKNRPEIVRYEMLKKAKAESQAYWDAVSAKITSITNEHAELRQLFSQISAREKDKQL